MHHPTFSHRQLDFLISELLIVGWNASVQRAYPYDARRGKHCLRPDRFRKQLLAYVERELLPHYFTHCTEQQHLDNLQALCAEGTRIGGDLLPEGGYRLANAQKLLNLLLKLLWALGCIPEPPHCPVDKLIMTTASTRLALNWTRIKTIEDYMLFIRELKSQAAVQGQSLAAWELASYGRRNPLQLALARDAGGQWGLEGRLSGSRRPLRPGPCRSPA